MSRRPMLDDHSAVELVALALFFIGGAILGLAIGVVYIGINLISVLGAQWHWLWE